MFDRQTQDADLTHYYKKGILIDTNLLLLLLIGLYKKSLIATNNRTSKYEIAHFESLSQFIESKALSCEESLHRLGFTDLSIQRASQNQKYLVITDDYGCYANLLQNSIQAINFSHYVGSL